MRTGTRVLNLLLVFCTVAALITRVPLSVAASRRRALELSSKKRKDEGRLGDDWTGRRRRKLADDVSDATLANDWYGDRVGDRGAALDRFARVRESSLRADDAETAPRVSEVIRTLFEEREDGPGAGGGPRAAVRRENKARSFARTDEGFEARASTYDRATSALEMDGLLSKDFGDSRVVVTAGVAAVEKEVSPSRDVDSVRSSRSSGVGSLEEELGACDEEVSDELDQEEGFAYEALVEEEEDLDNDDVFEEDFEDEQASLQRLIESTVAVCAEPVASPAFPETASARATPEPERVSERVPTSGETVSCVASEGGVRSQQIEQRSTAQPPAQPPAVTIPGLECAWVSAVPAMMEDQVRNHLLEYGIELAHNFADVRDELDTDEYSRLTIEELAIRDAVYCADACGCGALAERTFLEVDALKSAASSKLLPSAAAAYRLERVDSRAEQLISKLATVSPPDRQVRFVTVFAFASASPRDGAPRRTVTSRFEVLIDIVCATASMALLPRTQAFQDVLELLGADASFSLTEGKMTPCTFEFFELRSERALVGSRPFFFAAEFLRERLREDARVLPNGNIDVSTFIGASVDVGLLDDCATEIAERLGAGQDGPADFVTKVLTTGASGQQLALPLARLLSVPLICARRETALGASASTSSPLGRVAYGNSYEVTYGSKHFGPGQQLFVPRGCLDEHDVVLVVDDFLASGSCQEAMLRLVTNANAKPAALAVLFEKAYERGRDFLAGYDVPVVSLASILSVTDGYIELEGDNPDYQGTH